MTGWYWSNYRQQDNLKSFAEVWEKRGILTGICFVSFMVAGLSAFLAATYCWDKLGAQASLPLVCGTFAGCCIGIGGLFYGGIASASLAHSVQRRMKEMEERIEQLEAKVENTH